MYSLSLYYSCNKLIRATSEAGSGEPFQRGGSRRGRTPERMHRKGRNISKRGKGVIAENPGWNPLNPIKTEESRMKLVTKEIENKLPGIGSTDGKDKKDVAVVAKFFTPDSNWTWYVTEGERKGSDFLFFGLVDGFEKELGYFTLSQIESIRGPLGLKVERDLYFGKRFLSELM